jgi:hypothetical protein
MTTSQVSVFKVAVLASFLQLSGIIILIIIIILVVEILYEINLSEIYQFCSYHVLTKHHRKVYSKKSKIIIIIIIIISCCQSPK